MEQIKRTHMLTLIIKALFYNANNVYNIFQTFTEYKSTTME